MSAWYKSTGKQGDVAVSTRIRLARNIAGLPFPAKWSDSEARQVIESVRSSLDKDRFTFLMLDNTPELNKQALVEEHLMSREMLTGTNKALLLSKDEQICIMLGEEDHIRLQAILPGFDLEAAYAAADQIDDALAEHLDYAFDETFGFLTRCPTNVGTGLRASVMLHLPALKMSGQMNALIGQVGKLGLTIRGMYGEGSEAKGDLFQLSNQVTLGISEHQLLEKLASVTNQIITTERDLRQKLLAGNPDKLPDQIMRALGTLKYARLLSSAECEKLLSDVKLGTYLGIVTEVSAAKLTELMIQTQPAHINLKIGESLNPAQRDLQRSRLVREALSKKLETERG